jgi:hypothetical protein
MEFDWRVVMGVYGLAPTQVVLLTVAVTLWAGAGAVYMRDLARALTSGLDEAAVLEAARRWLPADSVAVGSTAMLLVGALPDREPNHLAPALAVVLWALAAWGAIRLANARQFARQAGRLSRPATAEAPAGKIEGTPSRRTARLAAVFGGGLWLLNVLGVLAVGAGRALASSVSLVELVWMGVYGAGLLIALRVWRTPNSA